jgi:dephospho-CoA kinase
MLEHLGAYGIDADSLANRITSKGFPGYQPVINAFGSEVLGKDQEIDRTKLGKVVFTDPQALRKLEMIIHPLVREAVDKLMGRIEEKVVVIEAIKLLESGMREDCDSLWVANVPEEIQLLRLVEKRGLTAPAARIRVDAQPSQSFKIAQADVIIENKGTYKELWLLVKSAWDRLTLQESTPPGSGFTINSPLLQRIQPSQAIEVSTWLENFSSRGSSLNPAQAVAAFAEKGFSWMVHEGKTTGLVLWNIENFIARVEDVVLDRSQHDPALQQAAIDAIEHTAIRLLCEMILISAGPGTIYAENFLYQKGYRPASKKTFQKRARKEAYESFRRVCPVIWYKELGTDPASLCSTED